MFKDLLRLLFLLSVFIIGSNLIALCQKITNNMPDYMMLLTIVCMLVVFWVQFIKLLKSTK